MIILGLTGSIGMGKSTTAGFFAEAGAPVYDADGTVHRLYRGEVVPLVEALFPGVSNADGIDRAALARRLIGDADAIRRLEEIIHPLVRREEERFVAEAQRTEAPVAVLDIPLLFETGGEQRVDAIVVVTAPAEMQRERALSRPGMTEEKFQALLARQMPDAEKRRRADFVVDTSQGYDFARQQVHAILQAARAMPIRRVRPQNAGF
jgi:dephospho-CoA kinase